MNKTYIKPDTTIVTLDKEELMLSFNTNTSSRGNAGEATAKGGGAWLYDDEEYDEEEEDWCDDIA